MAKRIITKMTDDLTPDVAADETVTFGIDGINYEIDLSEAHAAELRELFSPYMAHGRRIYRGPVPRAATVVNRRQETQAIREWANSNGWNVNERGRIPTEVMTAYRNGTPGPGLKAAEKVVEAHEEPEAADTPTETPEAASGPTGPVFSANTEEPAKARKRPAKAASSPFAKKASAAKS